MPKRSIFVLLALLFFVFVCSITIHPFGRVKESDAHAANVIDATMPLEVKTLMARSCVDCHSVQTVWPWYSYVAPMSWLVERDVRRGRDQMNLSHWSQYSLAQKQKLLAKIATVVKNGDMPLPQYVLIHRDAKLSNAEIDILYQWARHERRSLRSAISSQPGNIRVATQVWMDERTRKSHAAN